MAKKILLIDDEPDILKTFKTRLEKSGYTVVTGVDEKDCFKKAAEEKPDLILLDVLLPGIGGFEVCRELKKSAATKKIPVIMLTALIGESALDKALGVGARSLISKPCDPEDLLWQIEDAIKNKR